MKEETFRIDTFNEKRKRCLACSFISDVGSIEQKEHYWHCPKQTDGELLRALVEKVRELSERFDRF